MSRPILPLLPPSPRTCSHRFRRAGGCRVCDLPHDVAPYIEPGNHRAMEPGATYVCRCGRTLHITALVSGDATMKEDVP